MERKTLRIRSLSINYLLYNLRTVLDVLIPLIIFPYVTRVLGPTNLGKVNFAESILGYFVIFSQLGIPAYGVREIARMRDSVYDRSCVFWELSLYLLVTTFVSTFIYLVVILFAPRFNNDFILYLVILPNLIFTNFSYEWFYTGIEDQMFITVRYLFIKIIQCVLILSLVRSSSQYIIYAGILVGMNSISALFNVIHARNYLIRIPFAELNLKRHLRFIFIIFASVIGIQINRVLDITMIGFMIDERSVSIYVVANRIVMIVRTLILGIVFAMNPRIENTYKLGDINKYKDYVNYSLYLILILAIPATIAINQLAPEIVDSIAGTQYTESILSMRLLSPIIIIVGIANVIVSLVLYPHRDENKYTIAVLVASVANVIFNYIMIPIIGHNGAVIGTVISEFISLSISLYFAIPYLKENIVILNFVEIFKYLISSITIVIVIILIKYYLSNNILVLVISVLFCIPIYFTMLYILKSEITQKIMLRIMEYARRK